MDVLLASTSTAGLTLLIFGIQEFIRDTSVSSEYENSISKNRCPSNEPQNTKWNFCFLEYVSVIYGQYKKVKMSLCLTN
jgi:hypothetical protein